jgi:5'-nucleotidase
MSKRWKLILFDLDNTFYSNEHSWEHGIPHAIQAMNYPEAIEAEDFYRTFKQMTEELLGAFERREMNLTEYRRERYIRTVRHWGREVEEEEADRFHRHFASKVMEFVKPFPMLLETIKALSDEYKLGIVTNGPQDHQHQKIDRLGLKEWFGEHNMINSQQVGMSKPEPGIFKHALEKLGGEPETTLFIGDSWEADIVGSMDLGMDAIWINTFMKKPSTEHKPLAIIDRFDELLPLVHRLKQGRS